MSDKIIRNEFDLPPLQCSQGGFAFNAPHIEYWKARALAAEASVRVAARTHDTEAEKLEAWGRQAELEAKYQGKAFRPL